MDEGPPSPIAFQHLLEHAHMQTQKAPSAAAAVLCSSVQRAIKRPASTELDELGRSLGMAVRVSPSLGGRSTPDWPVSPVAALAAARQEQAVAGCSAAAIVTAKHQQQAEAAQQAQTQQPAQQHVMQQQPAAQTQVQQSQHQAQQTPLQTPPPPPRNGGHALTNVVLESARRLSQTLHVSPPVSTRAASGGAGSPSVPLALSRLHGSSGAATPPGRPCTPSDPASPSAARLLCDEAPLEFVDSPSRPGTGLLGLFSAHIPTAPASAASGPGRMGLTGLRPVAIGSPGAPRGMDEEDTPSPCSGGPQPWGTPTTGQQPSSPDYSTWGSPGSWGPGEDGVGSRHGSAAGMGGVGACSGAGAHGEGGAAYGSTHLPSCVLPLPISSLSSRLAAMQAGGLLNGPSPNRAGGPVPGTGSPLRRSSAAGLPAWPGLQVGGQQQQQQQGAQEAEERSAWPCNMECEGDTAAPAAAAAARQQQSMVQVSVYGQDGAVALLDPGFLRPDSPMCMEVPTAAAAAAAAWAAVAPTAPPPGAAAGAGAAEGATVVAPNAEWSEAAPACDAGSGGAGAEPAGVLTGGDLGLASIRTHVAGTQQTGAAAAGPGGLAADSGAAGLASAQQAAAAVGAAAMGDPLVVPAVQAGPFDGNATDAEAAAAAAGAALPGAAAALLAGALAVADAQPGTPGSARDTAPQLDRRRSSRQIPNSLLGPPQPPRRASNTMAAAASSDADAGAAAPDVVGAPEGPDALADGMADHRSHGAVQQQQPGAGGADVAMGIAGNGGAGVAALAAISMAIDDEPSAPPLVELGVNAGTQLGTLLQRRQQRQQEQQQHQDPGQQQQRQQNQQAQLRQQAMMPATTAWRVLSGESWGSPRADDSAANVNMPVTPDHQPRQPVAHHANLLLQQPRPAVVRHPYGSAVGGRGGSSSGGVASLLRQCQEAGGSQQQMMRGSWESSAPGSPIGETLNMDMGWECAEGDNCEDYPCSTAGAVDPSAPPLQPANADGEASGAALRAAAAALYAHAHARCAVAVLPPPVVRQESQGLAHSWGSALNLSGAASPCPSAMSSFTEGKGAGDQDRQRSGSGAGGDRTSGGAARTRHRLATQGAPAGQLPRAGYEGGPWCGGGEGDAPGIAALLLAGAGSGGFEGGGDGGDAGVWVGGDAMMEADYGNDDRDQAGGRHEVRLFGTQGTGGGERGMGEWVFCALLGMAGALTIQLNAHVSACRQTSKA